MRNKWIVSLGVLLAAVSAHAWHVAGVVSCPNGNSAAGITLSVAGVGTTTTAGNGAYLLELPDQNGSYTICIDTNTLPAGATVSGNTCRNFSVDGYNPFADNIDFQLSGAFCTPPPPQGACWLTGGGTLFKVRGKPTFSFGGVVNPGCSPTAAGGGNWNVVDHKSGLHFKGLDITVTSCSGVPTRSPRVHVNVIDFTGTGTIGGISGNNSATVPVCFTARAVDVHEGGARRDRLYLRVYDCSTGATLMLISGDTNNPSNVSPVPISTGNLQIHTTSCD